MARTALAYSALNYSTAIADPTGTAIASGAGNGGQLPQAATGGVVPEQTIFRVSNASGGAGTVSVLPGTSPLNTPGSLVLTAAVANGATTWLGPFGSDRFAQSDGSLIVESSVAVTVTAFRMPRH